MPSTFQQIYEKLNIIFLVFPFCLTSPFTLKDKLISLVNKYDLQKNIKFHGFVNDQNTKSELLFSSDVFIGPSHSEALGLVFIEALAHGLPVIGSKTGGIPEIINSDAFGLLVTPEDINEIKQQQTVYSLAWCQKYNFPVNTRCRFLNNANNYNYIPNF